MSEVKRVNIDFSGLQGPADSISTGHPDAGAFYAEKYEAQRLRADTAEAELKRLDNLDTMQLIAELTKRNAAAEQRIAELVAAFTPLIKNWDDLAAGESMNVDRARAALNQKSEVESQ